MKKLTEFDHISTPEEWINDALKNAASTKKSKIIKLNHNNDLNNRKPKTLRTKRDITSHISKAIIAAAVIILVISAGTISYISGGWKFALTPKEQEINEKPFVILLSGTDQYGDDLTKNQSSDANVLVAVNPKTKKLSVVSMSRDSYVYINVKDKDNRLGAISGYDKLNNASLLGMDTLKDTMEQIYDLPVDYYSKVNFSGLPAFIDAIGGITVHSDYDFTTGLDASPVEYTFHQGENECDGDMALAFCRERKNLPPDNSRELNQISVVKAVLEKLMKSDSLYRFDEVAEAISNMMLTDMTKETMIALIKEQGNSLADWEFTTDYVNGATASKNLQIFGLPNCAVVLPYQNEVEDAKRQMEQVLQGN